MSFSLSKEGTEVIEYVKVEGKAGNKERRKQKRKMQNKKGSGAVRIS